MTKKYIIIYKIIYKNNTSYNSCILNIYFVFKNIRKGCFINLHLSENNSNKLDILLDKLKLYYNKYNQKDSKDYLYCISKNIIKKDFFGKYYKIKKFSRYFIPTSTPTITEIGEFLGYECPGDSSNCNQRKKTYYFYIKYENYTIYSYICKELDINKLIKQLKLINKMNRLLRKYLYNKLNSEIVFTLTLS